MDICMGGWTTQEPNASSYGCSQCRYNGALILSCIHNAQFLSQGHSLAQCFVSLWGKQYENDTAM